MKRLTITSLVLVLMAAITEFAIGVLVASAQENKEVYVPKADLKTLVDNKPLHGVDGKHVTIVHGAFPAGWLGGRHYHTGPVYVYVLEGSFTIDEQGKPRQTFTVGQLYEEPSENFVGERCDRGGASCPGVAGGGSAQREISSTDLGVNIPLGEVHRVVHCQSAASQTPPKPLI